MARPEKQDGPQTLILCAAASEHDAEPTGASGTQQTSLEESGGETLEHVENRKIFYFCYYHPKHNIMCCFTIS